MQWVQPEWIWGVVTRLVGLTYLITFVSLSGQVLSVAGSRGTNPVGRKLATIRRDFPGPRRFLHFPSLLWLGGGADGLLRALPLLGALCALGVVVGGPQSTACLVGCYVLYLSLDVAMRLTFPWECVLFEAGVLALFLPATLPLPELASSAAPAPLLAWAYRLLLFRVLFGFGKFKFIGSTRQDRGFLRGFLINQPLPSPLAAPASRLPLGMLEAGLWALFVVEIILPFGALVPGPSSVVAAAGFIGLMVVIQLSGNFGFFNLLVAFLSLSLLDQQTPRALELAALLRPGGIGPVEVVVLLHMAGGLLHLPMNQYFGQCWLHWPVLLRVLPAPLRAPLAFFRVLHPFRWVQSYGVFPPKSMAPVRNVAVVEASWDGEHWQELRPRWAPTTETDRPGFMAPHHARYAQALIYESYGTNDHGLAYSVAGTGVPYYHSRRSDARCLMQRLLEGERYEGVIFEQGTFGDHAGPPLRVRMRTFVMRPLPPEAREGGRYWERTYVGPHQPETMLEEGFWEEWLPDAELWDWDSIIWRRRSRLGPWLRRARGGEATDALVVGDGVTATDLDDFFEAFLPVAARTGDGDFEDALADAVERLRASFPRERLRVFERVLARLTLALSAQLEPAFFSGDASLAELPTYLHLRMLCQRVIGEGRIRYEAVRAAPSEAAALVPELDLESGMWLHALFDLPRLVHEAKKIRLLDSVLVRATERFPGTPRAEFEIGIDRVAKGIWGVAHLSPWLRGLFTSPRFDDGQPERYPLFELREDGSIVPSDDGAALPPAKQVTPA